MRSEDVRVVGVGVGVEVGVDVRQFGAGPVGVNPVRVR